MATPTTRISTIDVITSDISQLYSERLKLSDRDEHVILADAISKEPLGPAVRQDDPKWATLAKWVHFALPDAVLPVIDLAKSIGRLVGPSDEAGTHVESIDAPRPGETEALATVAAWSFHSSRAFADQSSRSA